jgi:hypothetical protein
MSLWIRLGVWHKSETEAKKLKSSCFSSPSASDQAVQPVGELQLRVRQKAACHIKTHDQVMSRPFLTLIRHVVITPNVSYKLHAVCNTSRSLRPMS